MRAQDNITREQGQNSFLPRVIKLQIVIAVITVIISVLVGIQIPSVIRELQEKREELNKINGKLEQANGRLEQSKQVLLAINPVLEKYGVLKELTVDNLNSNLVKQSFEANQQIQQILSESFKGRNVPVRYYTKDQNVDPAKVGESLNELGFNVDARPPGRPDLSTNLVAFGNQVNGNDAKLVAYTLIRAGKDVKGMCKISNPSKTSNIEVLADDRLLDKPALTVEQIRNKTVYVTCPPNNVPWPQE